MKYAAKEKVINQERAAEYREWAMQHEEAAEYVNTDLVPRLNAQRAKVAHLRYRLQGELNKLADLEREFKEFEANDKFDDFNVYESKSTFEAALTDSQICSLLPVMNKWVFTDTQTVATVQEWLRCENTEPVRVKDIGELGYILRLLADGGYICGNAQTVAEENKTFIGGRGAIVTQKSISASITKKYGDSFARSRSPILNKETWLAVESLKDE